MGKNFKKFPTPQSLVAVRLKALGGKMGNFFAILFSLTQYFFVVQNLFIKKVSHFPTYGSKPYSRKGLEGGKLFKKVSQLTKSFPPLTIGIIAITLDTVGVKHGFDKAVKMRKNSMVKKSFPPWRETFYKSF